MMRPSVVAVLLAASAAAAAPLAAQLPGTTSKEIKWVRDAEEYAALTRQVYRTASRAVEAAARQASRGAPLVVVLDIDETTLDNSAYMLERAAYQQPYDEASWRPYVSRAEAGVVPGVQDFIATVRRLGGRVVWLTDRDSSLRAATIANLGRFGLWNDADLLCLQNGESDTKVNRRAELAGGTGRCAWPGNPASAAVYVGDHMGDFPGAGENDPDAGNDAAFGSRFFLLPDPMYGAWEHHVTRRR